MNKWDKFSEPGSETYDEFKWIWVSDGKIIKPTSSLNFLNVEDKWIYWTPIQEPELPNRKLHDCYSTKVSHLSCYETLSGDLLLDFQGITEKAFSCPFCGYNSRSKE